ncbi:hypothetical protein Daura_44855 [Dactylosporangium aurantiacum]|uniref:Uncharacterized protein n=1 Tax=Dactylosporangium aurantiacum TaxID=35754 RepID=A0A9Q9IHP6_9ACTN|nr:hypothetical protein [Dactylosporangium aurantiacum]MDG6102088.1 hypothetical protein [Dactylosporangium aurantiacum]UWZ53584.1 hypothetical protein Daura_44855 [Dactylosporangium aurantiacum]
MAWLNGAGVEDARAFLARAVRLDEGAVVRLRPAGDDRVTLWSRLPWGVLVSRGVPGRVDGDHTVLARELLTSLDGDLPTLRDDQWRWSIPGDPGTVVERIPAADIRRVGAAAADTLRTAAAEGVGGRAVGSRVLRDALLDHVPIIVTTAAGDRVEIAQRLVQAVVRMGFLISERAGARDFVDVRKSGPWTALACAYGSAWHRAAKTLLIG